jgi:hypothetical protein
MLFASFKKMIQNSCFGGSFCMWTLCLLMSNAWADGWVQPKHKALVSLAVTYYETDIFYDKDGHRVDVPRFTKYEIQPYMEYGLTDAVTLGLSDGVHYLKQDQRLGNALTNEGDSGSELFGRVRLWQDGAAVLSVQPFVKTPAYARRHGAAPRGAPKEWQTGASLQGGYGLEAWGLHHYVTLNVGWRERFSAAHDQFLVRVAGGVSVSPDWQLLPEISFEHPTHLNTDATRSVSGVNDYALTKLQLMAQYSLSERVQMQAGLFWHVAARNTGDNGGVRAALLYAF